MSLKLLAAIGWGLILATLYLMAFILPLEEKVLGTSYLIFFYHFPSAINCLVFFGIAAVASLKYLSSGSTRADQIAVAAVEVGVLACTITLVTGSIWARAAWSVWWRWNDLRLMTVAIMWLTYLGYLALRSSVASHVTRARYSAIFAVVAMVNVPLVWFAPRIIKLSHPKQNDFEFVGEGRAQFQFTMWFGAGAFLVFYLAVMLLRARVARLEDEGEELAERLIAEGL